MQPPGRSQTSRSAQELLRGWFSPFRFASSSSRVARCRRTAADLSSPFRFQRCCTTHAGRSPARRCTLIQLSVSLHRPLVDMAFVCACLNVSRERAFEMIESGELLWAWNLAPQKHRRTCVRVLAESLANRMQGRRSPRSEGPLDIQRVVHNSIFPGYVSRISAKEVWLAWGVDHDVGTATHTRRPIACAQWF